MRHITVTTLLSWISRLGLAMLNTYTTFEVSICTSYEDMKSRCKMKKIGWFGAVRGHSRSIEQNRTEACSF